MIKSDRPLYDDTPSHGAPVRPAPADEALKTLVQRRPSGLRTGTCGWASPGWRGIVYARSSGAGALRGPEGLAAYARFPLMNTVSLERNFREPYRLADFQRFAAAVPEDFRFAVPLPAVVTDPFLRDRAGRALSENPRFLDTAAAADALSLAVRGLGAKCGPVLLEFAPFPRQMTADSEALQRTVGRLEGFMEALQERNLSQAVLGAELRTPSMLTPRFVAALGRVGVRLVMGLHPMMPGALRQSRALRHCEDPADDNPDWGFSGPLIVRWSRSPSLAHAAKVPGDAMPASDPATRAVIASLIVRAQKSRMPAWILAGNRAEGSAPGTLRAVLESVVRQCRDGR